MNSDPREQPNIYGTELAPDTTDMARRLGQWTEQRRAIMQEYAEECEPGQLPAQVLEGLKDMGYIQ